MTITSSRWIRPILLIALLISFRGQAATGLCEINANGPLPSAVCTMPQCQGGPNCTAPTLSMESATLSYSEPSLQWSNGSCPGLGSSGCWNSVFTMTLSLAANDWTGIQDIGIQLRTEIRNTKTRIDKWYGPALKLDAQGRYSMSVSFGELVPPGRTVVLSPLSLCARDRLGNETCVVPKNHLTAFSMSTPSPPRASR